MISGKPSKSESAALLLYQMNRLKETQQPQDDGLNAQLSLLRRWQAERLARTHADLLHDSRYRPAAEFFLEELYGDKDFSRRDHDVERAYPIMVRTMPAGVLRAIATSVELHALSSELNIELLRVLVGEFGLQDQLSEETYVSAYRHCNNYDHRAHQIELIHGLGTKLSTAVHNPLVYAALVLARGPAYLAGFGKLQEFIEWGFRAFRNMENPDDFLNTIVSRELQLLDRIYRRDP